MKNEEQNRDKLYINLVILFKMFKNKPHLLANYLLDHDAFNDFFLEKIIHSKKLNEMEEKLRNDKNPFVEEPKHFNNISEMKKHQLDILKPALNSLEKEDLKRLEKDLNKQLKEAEEKEDYEKAVTIRDYMMMLNLLPPKK